MRHRFQSLLLLTAVLFVIAAPSGFATEVPAFQVLAVGEGPAVEAPSEVADEEEQPWTARFLAPAVLVLGVVALGGSVLYYGVRIRGRYKVTP